MAVSYSNVPGSSSEMRLLANEARHRGTSFLKKGSVRAVACGMVLLVLPFVGALLRMRSATGQKPLRGSSPVASTGLVATKSCGKLWDQCGGDGHTGPTCCTESKCEHHPLKTFESFHQCRPTCGAPEPGSKCASMIEGSKSDSWANPERYHGLTGDMDDKEFQMFLHWGVKEESQCPEPCADGTCYFALHVEGCDTLGTWYCEQDDGSLKYACCCSYFHKETELDKPQNVDADMANAMEAVGSSSPTLFCTAMVLPHGYELDLLRAQYQKGKSGLFDCNEWALYSNESLVITPEGEKPVIRTGLINGSLSAEVGGNWGTALNTDVFIRFWDRVIQDPKSWKCEWVVKVDPDTMWLPMRLRALLRTDTGPLGQPEPVNGLFLNNCHVGLHGPIEVLSHRALHTYKHHSKLCQVGNVSKIGQEDRFLHQCFLKLNITQVDAYNLMLEATLACQEVASAEDPDRPPCFSPQVAFHPFKTIDTWMRCQQEANNHPWALPVVPVTDEPSEANNRHG